MNLVIEKDYLRALETTQKELFCHNCFKRDSSQWYFDEVENSLLCEKCTYAYFPTMKQEKVECTFFAIGEVRIVPSKEAAT